MKRKKRKLRRSVRLVLLCLLPLCIIGLLFFIGKEWPYWSKHSQHETAKRYRNGSCMVFYPAGASKGKQVAEQLCADRNERTILDYELISHGDIYAVRYEGKDVYLLDKAEKEIAWPEEDDQFRTVLRDYLIDGMRQANREETKQTAFYENTDLQHEFLGIENENMRLLFNAYQIEIQIPLTVLARSVSFSLGVEKAQKYLPPHTLSLDKPIICFTYDDGPNQSSSVDIVNTLDLYGAKATFFVVGSRLGEAGLSLVEHSLARGNEYASHTYSHPPLTSLSVEEMRKEIMSPANILKEKFNYDVKLLRPPYGDVDERVRTATSLKVTLWNVDSEDWKSRDVEKIIERVKKAENEDVVLFHDIFDESAEATKRLIPYFLEQGYQFATVSELLKLVQENSR